MSPDEPRCTSSLSDEIECCPRARARHHVASFQFTSDVLQLRLTVLSRFHFSHTFFCTETVRTLASLVGNEGAAGEDVFPSVLPKAFDFSAEEKIYAWWEGSGYFKPDESALQSGAAAAAGDSSDKTDISTPFVISMPPPNVTGALHMGHAMFVTLEDIMARFWRMKGRPTLWLPGTDHAGIATQLVVEKMLASEGISRKELGREEFVKRVWEWKEKYGGTIAKQIRRLGASCDWSRERFTLDDQLSKAVVEAFVRLHNKGLIYRGTYMVNWSPFLQTAVSDLEVEYSEEPGTLYFFKYPIVGGTEDDYLPVATTRPETILGDTAVAVHPEDERFKKFVGKQAVVPMCGGRTIPIIADDYVDMEFGTGCLKITPGHDINDYAIGQRRDLPIINILNKDATLNENAGAFCGLDRFEARKQVWEQLEKEGLAIKQQPHMQRVPRSQREGEVVEPLVSRQWFVRMQPLAEPALEAARTGELKIIPERFEKIYEFWLDNIRDWCISRQLWWGHRIPVFYPSWDSAPPAPLPGKGTAGAEEGAVEYVVAGTEAEAREKVREMFGDEAAETVRLEQDPDVLDTWFSRSHLEAAETVRLEQDPDVLDTWFSSGLWPFSTLGWPNESAQDYQKYYPTSVMETGHDILFFWVAHMTMMGLEFTGKLRFQHDILFFWVARMTMMGLEFTGKLPFHTIYLHGLVRDAQIHHRQAALPHHTIYLHGLVRNAQGRKMSKSLGNVVDPLDTINEFGTDALRYTLATGTTPGQDVNLSMERLGANRAFVNKIWNAGKFIRQNLPSKDDEKQWQRLGQVKFDTPEALAALPLAERWLLSRLHTLVDEVTEAYIAYEFNAAGRRIYDFFWSDFADWYIEASKTRLYSGFRSSSSSGESSSESENEGQAKESQGAPADEAQQQAQAVLAYAFDSVLRLLHPFMPFASEQLWQALPHDSSLPTLMLAPWPAAGLPRDTQAQEEFDDLQALTQAICSVRARKSDPFSPSRVPLIPPLPSMHAAIRNVRAEYSVEPAKKIAATVIAAPALSPAIQGERDVLALLARVDPSSLHITSDQPDAAAAPACVHGTGGISAHSRHGGRSQGAAAPGQAAMFPSHPTILSPPNAPSPCCSTPLKPLVPSPHPCLSLFPSPFNHPNPDKAAAAACVHVVAAEGLEAYLPIADMVDVPKELQRLGKQQTKLTADVNSCRSRLSSKKFVDKAPAAVVDGVRKQAEEAEEKLALVNRRLEQLQGMAATATTA
ncbi:unnamed protein product [Closterium sp. Naga37s-1]|nr:unnamed protein product [Closterium sp. Naga37s-1]